MSNAIYKYEVAAWLRSPLFYFLILSFFLFSLVTMLGTADFFDGPINSNDPVNQLNSPHSLSAISFIFAKLLMLVVAIFAGTGLYKDYRHQTHAVLYTFPISKSYYLNGKLASAIFALVAIGLLVFLGIWIGETILGIGNPRIMSTSVLGHVTALGLYLLPTLIIVGLLVFVAVGFSGNIYSGFIVVLCLVLLQLILENVLFQYPTWLALLDPFGQNAFQLATHNWDFQKVNSHQLPIDTLVIGNRILWLSIALLAYRQLYLKFDFQYDAIIQLKSDSSKRSFEKKLTKYSDADADIHYRFSWPARLKASVLLMMYDLKSILRSWLFIVPCLLGMFTIFFIQFKVTNSGDFNLLPVTRLFLGAPLSIYTLLIIFTTFIFSGLLIHKSRQRNLNLMLDATPVTDWQWMLSKIGAISAVQVVQLSLFVVIGVAIQLFNGYQNFEIGLYFYHLLILVLPVLFVWNVTSHLVHTLVPNLFLGIFLLAGLWLGAQSLDQLGIHTYVFKFNFLPNINYSDLYGYDHQLKGYLTLMFYWILLGLAFMITTLVLWNRGSMTSLKERYFLARSRTNRSITFLFILLIANFIWLGTTIYTSESQGHSILDKPNSRQLIEAFKKEWSKFGQLTPPKIKAIHLHIDLFPSEERFTASGTYTLVNESAENIDTVLVRTGFDEITNIHWHGRATLLKENEEMKNQLFKLNRSLQPGDSVQLTFNIQNSNNTLFTRQSNVLKNGTYLRHDFLPRLGYQFIETQLPLTDSLVHQYNYFHRDANYVNLTTTITTFADQIAIAPGACISERDVDGRKLYEYQTDHPVKFNFSFHSGKFELKEEKYHDLTIQVYHAKGHGQNTASMIDGLKASLDYNTRWFDAYPYQQVRIIEFPHTEESYSATLTANNIPASEILFNINAKAMDDKINLPFYVMAHELTHEWFGNQIMPADAEGAKMLTESMAEYLTLCIYQEHLGSEMADHFIRAQNRRYSRGKKAEKDEERPLNKVLSHQEYIAYGKGAIAFKALSQSMGIEKFNDLLTKYVSAYRFQSDAFPTSNDFIDLLKANTSEAEHALIHHWLTEVHSL